MLCYFFTGPAWAPVKSCRKRKGNKELCVSDYIPLTCKNSTHRVTKVLRFTVDNFDSFLMSRDNIKLIHLVRDPRAIINSRIGTNFFPTKDVLSIAEVLCNKMIHDFQAGRKLLMKYPKRFRFVYYEDLTDNPLDKIKALYKYLGFSLDETTKIFACCKY